MAKPKTSLSTPLALVTGGKTVAILGSQLIVTLGVLEDGQVVNSVNVPVNIAPLNEKSLKQALSLVDEKKAELLASLNTQSA